MNPSKSEIEDVVDGQEPLLGTRERAGVRSVWAEVKDGNFHFRRDKTPTRVGTGPENPSKVMEIQSDH